MSQPPAEWVLIAPDGRVWRSADPMVLAVIAARAVTESAPSLLDLELP